jgi:hypothetical protein
MTCILLHNIAWKTYEALVTDLADSAGIRLAYDRGTVEILDSAMPWSEPILLPNIRYGTYEQLMQDTLDRAVPRMAYHKGTLELMSPSSSHEDIKQLFVDIADAWAEARDVDIFLAGSTTFRKRGLPEGFEADASFYIANADAISRQRAIDLDMDPPPDLISGPRGQTGRTPLDRVGGPNPHSSRRVEAEDPTNRPGAKRAGARGGGPPPA